MLDFIRSGGGEQLIQEQRSVSDVRLAPVVSNPYKIIAIGLNYQDHVQESKGTIPESPVLFAKFQNTLIGHGEKIEWDPQITREVDYEAELAVIINQETSNCPEERAMEVIYGYTCANDVSARDLQFGDGQWVRGKSLNTFCPIGPWIVTADEISDPHNLAIRCILNGKIMQNSNTGQMIFKVPFLISFISRHITLSPGDVILTGTPSGVGRFRKPRVLLGDGDEVTVEIESIGQLSNRCRILS
jgi:2-keto-4-pentenoate hydratase/2-oxohepta-3-ene-1,7-dioic acid hydratase in catechol pathway